MTVDARRTSGGLGRGLASLIPTMAEEERPREILLRDIVRNPYQPRRTFDADGIRDLAASIAEHGLLQPILVTPVESGYQLVAGERRLRAVELCGLDRIQAVVRTADRQQQLALALVENLQRADLNAMDEARAFRQLIDEFGLTQDAVAARVGRSRPAITNTLRLLDTAAEVQTAVEEGRISEGHARAIAGLEDPVDQQRLLTLVEARQLSVRDTERIVRNTRETAAEPKTPRTSASDPDVERMEASLRSALATKVTLQPAARGGRITISYYDADDLARLYERLTGADR
ncbi:MAG: ParB family transcriptional regulator, chromosome partitioning protein [Chloroflexota bacterium]|jgi:ParB family chromosome partitioning protein|nr:ParB family transcriptional regulator, chromosome partitioning protein [Chloroflexota bacterium]